MIANQKAELEALVPKLRDDLLFSNHRHGSHVSHMIERSEDGAFFSIGTREYRFICQLDGGLSLKDAHEKYLDQERRAGDPDRDQRLTWEQATEVFHFLHHQKLLESVSGKPVSGNGCPASQAILQNVNPYGFRLKLFNADAVSARLNRHFGGLFHRGALIAWILVNLWAILLIIGNSTGMMEATRVVLQPENWIWLTACWVFLKIIHESAHAICCKRLGGQVGDAGINFLLLLPMPYVDVSSSWRWESRWKRIAVALAGVYAELFVASLFVMVWAYTDHPVLDSIAVQMILMASLSTVLFNINPLMRFDGYYVLSDLLRRPNLATNGAAYQKNWLKQTLFGIRAQPALDTYDLTTRTYGWLAAVWKLMIAAGLIFAAAKLFHGAGIVLALAAIFLMYVKPSVLFVWSLIARPAKVQYSRTRCLISCSVLSSLVLLATWIPWPFAPSAVGIVDYSDQHVIRAPSDGFLVRILVEHGQAVSRGEHLVEIENQELKFRLQSLKIDRQIAVAQLRELKRDGKLAEYQAQLKLIAEVDEQLKIVEQQTGRLTLTAPHDGFVVSADLQNRLDAFFRQGDEIMKVVTPDSLEVVACASEFDVSLFRQSIGRPVNVAFESGQEITSHIERVEPTAVQKVFHPALSARNGGPLTVQAASIRGEDNGELELTQPVFKVITSALPDEESGRLASNPLGNLKIGQRCRIYLGDSSHSCFRVVCYKLARWLRNNWESQTGN